MGLGLVDSFVKLFHIFVGQLIFVVDLHLFGLVNGVIQIILGLYASSLFLVFLGVCLGFFSGFFNLVFIEIAAVRDGNALFFERSLYLRNASGCRRNTIEHEFTQTFAVGSHLSLTLQNVNFYAVLVISSG